jgi:hypothetical protein
LLSHKFIGNLDLTGKEWYWGTLDNPDKWFLYRKYEDALKDGLQEASLLILKILWKKVIK